MKRARFVAAVGLATALVAVFLGSKSRLASQGAAPIVADAASAERLDAAPAAAKTADVPGAIATVTSREPRLTAAVTELATLWEKSLLTEAESIRRQELLQDTTLLAEVSRRLAATDLQATLEAEGAPAERQVELPGALLSFKAERVVRLEYVHVLIDAMRWRSNPKLDAVRAQVEAVIAADNLENVEGSATKAAIAGDKIELYREYKRLFPEAARILKTEAAAGVARVLVYADGR